MKFNLCGDLHFRSDAPECRLDNYMLSQERILEFMREREGTWLCSGDVVHRARERKEPLTFTNWLMERIPEMYGVLGNHDLLYHSLENVNHTTMGTLVFSGLYRLLNKHKFGNVTVHGFHWGQEITHIEKKEGEVHIAVYHGMVMEEPNNFFEGLIAKDLLDKYPEYDLILTGDNHHSFVLEKDGRFLVNPGSLKRDNIGQIDYEPFIFIYDSKTKKLEKIPVPCDTDVISTAHNEKIKEKDERLEQLEEKFIEARDTTADMEENLSAFFKINKTGLDIQDVIESWKEVRV